MAWVRMTGGSKQSKTLFPPKDGWVTSGYGTFSLTDEELSVNGLPIDRNAYFSKSITPKNTTRTFKVVVQTNGAINFGYQKIDGTIVELAVGSLGSGLIEREFTLEANQSNVILVFHNGWSSAVNIPKRILSVQEI